MRRAKFFEDGQVFLDGQLPILAFVTVGKDDQATTAVRFPKTVKEAMGYEEGVQWPEEEAIRPPLGCLKEIGPGRCMMEFSS